MRVNVRLFAGLKEVVGRQEIALDLPDGATVADLRERVGSEFPRLASFLPALVCAVQEEYRSGDYRLHEGDEVALIPPISGG